MHTPYCSTMKTVMSVSDQETDSIFVLPFSLRRFRHVIETSDWDRKIVRREKWINGGCWLLVGLSLLYLCPILARLIFH